jgi:hypothetical protein
MKRESFQFQVFSFQECLPRLRTENRKLKTHSSFTVARSSFPPAPVLLAAFQSVIFGRANPRTVVSEINSKGIVMKQRNLSGARLLALCLCAPLALAAAAARAQTPAYPAPTPQATPRPPGGQQPAQSNLPTVPDAELNAARTVETAADAAASVAAADAFLKKYPKSPLRIQLARLLAGKIVGLEDAAQRVTLSERAATLFNAPDELAVLNPLLVEVYVKAKRMDDAFRVGGDVAVAEKFENPLGTMIYLAQMGDEEARRGNRKFVAQAQALGLRAVQLIESGQRPASLDEETWGEYRTKRLPQLYNSLAMLSMVGGNVEDAKAKLAKAVGLNSTEPFTYILMGSIADQEYQATAKAHQTATGAAKDELMKKAQGLADQAIEAFAHAVALTEGNAAYDQLRPQLMQALEWHYKSRKGSTDGMRAVIDKYKKSAAPKTQ